MELHEVHLCTEKHTPEDRVIDAAIKAVQENPKNAPRRRPPRGFGANPNGPLEMAVMTEKLWKPGRILRAKFMDGVSEVQNRVEGYAHEWEAHANVTFQFVRPEADADIRISFQQSGSWSYLGTDALVIADGEPTMNYGWLKPSTADNEYSRVVLHEFGHCLGCIHEHQHPTAGIPWDEAKVYQYYQITNGWSREMTKRNVLGRISASSTNFSTYDPTSIMQYSVPQELTLGDFSIGWNRVLSDTDKEFVSVIYPREDKGINELAVGQAVDAAIGQDGEEDTFRFTAPAGEPARYRVETRGDTDVVMSIYGPDDETRLLAEDDDSGQAFNAQVTREFAPGEYIVRLRHYSSRGTGEYQLQLAEA